MKKSKLEKFDLDLYYEKLDNGLDVYIIPKNNCNNVYVTFSTKFGSNDIEFVPINGKKFIRVNDGIAHFLEHKLFEQKSGVDPFTFYSENGADANANTTQKKTTYLFSGINYTIENINYLLDYVQEPYFTDKNVDKEKGIITQEIKMYQDDPDTIIYERLLNNLFVKHPMKYPIIGTIDSINKITKEELYTCYNTFYHPSNMFVVVTGNVNCDEIIEAIKENQKKKRFKKIDRIKIKEYDEPDNVCLEKETLTLNVSIPKVAYAYKIKYSKDLYKTLLYLLILFDAKLGATSNFTKKLIEEEIINSNLYIDYDHTDKHIIITIYGETKKPDILIDKINNEMKNLNITKEEFERKKKTLISSLIYISDNIFSLNHNAMNDIIRYGEVNTNKYDIIRKLDIDDLNKMKIDLSNTSYIIVKPKKVS